MKQHRFYGNAVRSSWFLKIKHYAKRTLQASAIMCLVMWGAIAGGAWQAARSHPIIVAVEAQVATSTPSFPPILLKIVQCESGGSQYDKNGQVLLHSNANGTVDAGWGQVNLSLWGATATKMGYDLSKLPDNQAFTLWLFDNKGSVPWSASSDCWNK